MASNIGLGILGGLGGLGHALYALGRQQRADEYARMKLLEGQGTFEPTPAAEQPERSFLQRLFGGVPDGYYDVGGGQLYRFQPYPELGEESARAMGLTTPVTQTYAPRQNLPLDDTPAGPLFATGLPTPATGTQETVPPAIARLRLSPKTTETLTLEQLKDNARSRRQRAQDEARLARTTAWLTKTPAGVQRLEWIIQGLSSDEDTTRMLAEAELSRLQSPGRRADTADTRLAQGYTMQKERLQAAMQMLNQRLQAAKERGDARAQAALEKQRERFAERLTEIELLEAGKDYRSELAGDVKLDIAGARSTQAGATADLTTTEAADLLQQLKTRWYFPGRSGDTLTTLERLIGTLQREGRSHVGKVITTRLRRLEQQLNNAERRGGIRPQTPPSAPPGTRPQSSSSSTTSSGTFSTSDPGPRDRMRAAHRLYYEKMTPEEAEGDLKAALQQDPLARSLVTQSKMLAYTTLWPGRQMQLQVPPASTPSIPTPAPPAAATPRQAATAAVTPERSAPTPTPTPQQAQVQARLRAHYERLSDQDLVKEQRRLQRAAPTDSLAPYRLKALEEIHAARQSASQPEALAPPAGTPPQKVLEHWRAHYQHWSTDAMLKEQQRLVASDPLATNVATSLRISALNQLITTRQSPPARKGRTTEETMP